MTRPKKTKRLVTPRHMWIALYVGNDSTREKRITNGEAWLSREMAEDWIKDEARDYAHEYRIERYALSRASSHDPKRGG